MTSQGNAGTRFSRFAKAGNLFAAEMALREMKSPSLLILLDYLRLLADTKPEKLPLAGVRWHGRLELEASVITLAESELALAAIGALAEGDRDALDVLRRMLRRTRPIVPDFGP